MEFHNMNINTIRNGTTSDGVSYLQLFLKAYMSLFNEKVNPSCPKCLNSYLTKYKTKIMAKNNALNPENSGYRLKAKYQNIPSEFGSQLFLNNTNLTDVLAQKLLLEHPKGEELFESMPEISLEAKSDAPKTLDELRLEKTEAIIALENLPEKVHHMTRKAAEKRVEDACNALAEALTVSDAEAEDSNTTGDETQETENPQTETSEQPKTEE